MAQKRTGILTEISKRPIAFSIAFLAFFMLCFGFLAAVGATPNPITSTDPSSATADPTQTATQTTDTANPESPVRVVAKDIGLDVKVVNPDTTDINALDDALTLGAVHYPISAPLGVNGTVLLFGHSSYLPVVYHSYYKTFDGIQDLKTGAIVSVYSGTTEYRYAVSGVRVADANDEDDSRIALPNDNKYLTLVTCDSFASKSNRFIVTATFVGAYNVPQS